MPKNRTPIHKKTMPLDDKHTWKAPDGYKIFVIDRGAVSFNIPEKWVLHKLDPVEIYDVEPPDDNARIMVTVWNLPPGVNWAGLPLGDLLTYAAKGDPEKPREYELLEQSEVTTEKRSDIDLVWLQHKFIDPIEKRPAYSRLALARGFDLQVFITFDFWVDDVQHCKPIWKELIHSLQMGRKIEDPLKGETLH
ncbi:MAG: hypothetical protein U0694_03290 [Anaerolineae bacterium]